MITIIGVLSALATSTWKDLITQARLDTDTRHLMKMLSLGRLHSLSGGYVTTLCPLDANECQPDWNATITLFADHNHNRKREEGEVILYEFQPSRQTRIRVRPVSRAYFQFKDSGLSRGTWGSITLCPDTGEARHAEYLTIQQGGRTRRSATRAPDGRPLASDGTPVHCD